MRRLALALALAAVVPAHAFDANGVKLGAREAEVKKVFPSAHCKALEWKTDAADRRCDDARISFGGAQARVTLYLKADAVRAFDVRFEAKDIDLVKAHLKFAYGPPLSEATEVIARANKSERKLFKMRWEKGADRAVLTAPEQSKRAGLEVWRGNFDTEVYRVK